MKVTQTLIAAAYFRHGAQAELQSAIRDAIAQKDKTIKEKEALIEIVDMLIVNGINMVEQLDFIEKKPVLTSHSTIRSAQVEDRKSVHDLIKHFNKITSH